VVLDHHEQCADRDRAADEDAEGDREREPGQPTRIDARTEVGLDAWVGFDLALDLPFDRTGRRVRRRGIEVGQEPGDRTCDQGTRGGRPEDDCDHHNGTDIAICSVYLAFTLDKPPL
jgi:hypothetical protein